MKKANRKAWRNRTEANRELHKQTLISTECELHDERLSRALEKEEKESEEVKGEANSRQCNRGLMQLKILINKKNKTVDLSEPEIYFDRVDMANRLSS